MTASFEFRADWVALSLGRFRERLILEFECYLIAGESKMFTVFFATKADCVFIDYFAARSGLISACIVLVSFVSRRTRSRSPESAG